MVNTVVYCQILWDERVEEEYSGEEEIIDLNNDGTFCFK